MFTLKESYKLIEQMSYLDKDTGEVRQLKLWKRQKEFLKVLSENRKVVTVKKRQVGFSLITGGYILACCSVFAGYFALVLSKTDDDAKEFLERIKKLYKTLPDNIKLLFKIEKSTLNEIIFSNGARIKCMSPKNGAGLTADLVVIDEAAYITPADSHITLEETFKRVIPTLDKSNGQVIVISTANGFNKFQELYKNARDTNNGWKSFFFSCWDDPTFNEEKRNQMIADFGEDFANESAPRTDIEAFLMSGRCKFNRPAMMRMLDQVKPGVVGTLSIKGDIVEFTEDENGWIEIFDKPNPCLDYVIGGDVAEGLENEGKDADYSTGIVLDVNMRHVARLKCRFDPKIYEEEMYKLGLYYNYALMGIERNKDGLGVLLGLKDRYKNLFFMEETNPDKQIKEKKLGFVTNKATKPLMINNLNELIKTGEFKTNDRETIEEFTTYVIFADGSTGAAKNCHDDLLIATGISTWIHKYIIVKRKQDQSYKDSYTSNKKVQQGKVINGISGY